MSSDVAWQVIRNNSCFLRRQRGIKKLFSTEKFNLKGRNSRRYNGLVNKKGFDVAPAPEGKGIVFSVKTKHTNNPRKSVNAIVMKNVSKTMRSISKVAKNTALDRHAKLAQRRAAVILRSQRPKRQKKNAKKTEA